MIILGTYILKIIGKMRTLGEFWKTNFELLAGNFEEMLEIGGNV